MDAAQTQVLTYSDTASLVSTSIDGSISPSDCTVTTSSTVPGLGEISGRAILALGKLTLRGAERVITRRRLDSIAAKFPHQNTDRILGIHQIYEDILELSRRDLYPNATRTRALEMILAQIGICQTQKLVEHLLGWPPIEIEIFISELTAMLDPLQLYSRRMAGTLSTPVRAYMESLATWESHSLEPFLVFLQQLAIKSISAGQAILNGGILDYFLHSYVSGFSDPLAQKDAGKFFRTSILSGSCSSLLTLLPITSDGLGLIHRHPFHVLWSSHPELPFTTFTPDRIIRRAQVWKSMDKELILWRIRSIMEILFDWHRPYEIESLMDITVDVLEFSGSKTAGPDIFSRALRSLHRLVSSGGNSARNAICQYQILSTRQHFVELMSCIIDRLSLFAIPGTPEWDLFSLPWNGSQFTPFDEEEFKWIAVLRIINAFTEAASFHIDFLDVVSEANMLGLLRPFLQQVIQDILYPTRHDYDGFVTSNLTDLEMVAIIRGHSFSSSDRYFLYIRRIILLHAFDVVVHRKQNADELERFESVDGGE